MTVRKVFSAARICILGLAAVSIAAGVHEVIDDTMSGAKAGLALHSPGRTFMMACKIAGSLVDQPGTGLERGKTHSAEYSWVINCVRSMLASSSNCE
jgi:hypothetical protein